MGDTGQPGTAVTRPSPRPVLPRPADVTIETSERRDTATMRDRDRGDGGATGQIMSCQFRFSL